MRRSDLIAYAMDFASYLIENVEKIDRIIIYGSTVRGDSDESSDIDLFIDTKFKLESKVDSAISGFDRTERFKRWKLKGIENSFSCIIGDLDNDEWRDLKRAIMQYGIVLFGRFTAAAEKSYQYTLISFENVKPESARVLLHRKLFGFRTGTKQCPGLLQKYKGMRAGAGGIVVPSQYASEFQDYFKEKKIPFKIYDFWSDVAIH